MAKETDDDPKTGPGTTEDPNQATRTEMPRPPEVRPDVTDEETDPDDPTTGPGSTTDPNQANRT